MTAIQPATPPAENTGTTDARQTPSLLAVNIYLLLGLLLLLWGSGSARTIRGQYVIGIAVEFALALGALLFQRVERLSVRQTLRLRWPGWQPVALSVALALGLWMMGVTLNLLTTLGLGYTSPASPSLYPRNLLDTLLLLFSTLIVAPVCEEVMFRGYVQRAYERRNPWTGVLVGGLIFALYHLRFQGAFALMPVALALGFVAWRSNSVLPGILLHATYNSIASIVLVATSFLPMQIVTGLILALICTGLLMVPVALAALWRLREITHPPVNPPSPRLTGLRRWLWALPIIVMMSIYGYAAVSEVIVGRFPEVLAVEGLAMQTPAAWDHPIRWRYAIHAGLNQTVGHATCDVTPQTNTVELTCEIHQEAFDTDLPFDIPALREFSVPGVSLTGASFDARRHAIWSKEDMQIRSLDGTQATATLTTTLALTTDGGESRLIVSRQDATETLAVPAGALIDGEWPWRLSALPFDIAYGSTVPLAIIDDDGVAQIHEAFVVVRGAEPAWTPAGNFVTWKVTITYSEGDNEVIHTAWYNVDAPHALVRYDNGKVSLLLAAVE